MDIGDMKATFPPIEVVTDKFRGTGQNFYTLPVWVFADLKQAQTDGTGEDLMVLMDAAALAFGEKEYEALTDLPFKDFMSVIRQWVDKSQP
jgi:hypothetical protein